MSVLGNQRRRAWAVRVLAMAIVGGAGGGAARAMDYLRDPAIGGTGLTQGQPAADERLAALAVTAVLDNPADAAKAVADLRAAGPAGLEALMAAHQAAIDRHRADPTQAEPMWEQVSAALDAVAAQKDAWASGAYWYTDLEAAKRAAVAADKPILSLRLLGTLDTEFSCANSRFFRTVLYPNARVGAYLKQHYVLHWQSYRPVPRLTIDFGDGRRIERTITGNSVHYVLTPAGRVVDVIPGLYGPGAFVRQLGASEALARLPAGPAFERALVAYHRGAGEALRRAWAADLAAVGAATLTGQAGYAVLTAGPAPAGKAVVERANGAVFALPGDAPVAVNPLPPAAAAAGRLAVSKGVVEMRPLLAMIPERAALAAGTADEVWAKVAARHAADAALDAGSRAVMRAKAGPDAIKANNLTRAKFEVETPLARLVRSFERSVAEDTVRNEYLLHGQVHEWFAAGTAPAKLDDLNERVYAELFLMPKTDPWLGLVPADAYTALPAGAGGR